MEANNTLKTQQNIKLPKAIAYSLIGVSSVLLSACSKHVHKGDPFEASNRVMFSINRDVDKVTLKPVAKVYRAIAPTAVREGVSNFYQNLSMPETIINDFLQAKFQQSILSTWRFAINSTLGIGGIFDTAQHMGLQPHKNDFGITLAMWGQRKSPYVVLPLFGPTTIRDGLGKGVGIALKNLYLFDFDGAANWALLGGRIVNARANLLDAEAVMKQASIDSYAFTRDAFLQNRNSQIAKAMGEDDVDVYIEADEDDLAYPDFIDVPLKPNQKKQQHKSNPKPLQGAGMLLRYKYS